MKNLLAILFIFPFMIPVVTVGTFVFTFKSDDNIRKTLRWI